MSIFRSLTSKLTRRPVEQQAEDIAAAGTAGRESMEILASASLSTQGARPYGRGY